MSDFDNALEILQSNNGIMNGTNYIDGIVPDLTNGFRNLVEAIESDEITEPETIPQNVNGGTYDPFTKIEIKRLYNDDGYTSHARNIRVKRTNGEYLEAGTVGQNYLLIPNQDVNDICSEIRIDSGMDWKNNKVFFDGKRYRNVYRTESLQRTLDNGDIAYLTFTEINSYDGSSPAGFRVDFMILVCKNGMVSPKYGWGQKFSHVVANGDWQQQIRSGAMALTGEMVEPRLNAFAQACNRLHNPLSMENLSEIRKTYISKLPNLRYGEILTDYHAKEGSTMWDFMQSGTSTLWHRDKMTNADFVNNSVFVDGLLAYGKDSNIVLTA